MKNTILITLVLSFVLISCQKEIKVACIGDSITHGGGKGDNFGFYPVLLNEMLGEQYQVLNCGEGGATMQTDGNKPYWTQKDLPNVFVFQPDVCVIMLGTNDSKTNNWNANSFERDYQLMIDTLKTLKSNPQIYVCAPPPAYSDAWNISDSTIRAGVIPIVNKLAKKNDLKVIDVYNGMTDMPEHFHDGIHHDAEGKKILAKIIADQIN